MKQLLSYFTMLTCLSVNALTLEFKVDCGNDTVFCRSVYAHTIHLGTQVKLLNGIAPYTYKWSCKGYKAGIYNTYTSSDFLNDTTLLNPYFKDFPSEDDRLFFYLTVKDSNNNVASDSITVRFSQFVYLLGYLTFYLNEGDSIQFSEVSVGGGISPIKYYWIPVDGLSDSADIHTWCKPVKSADYSAYAVDSAGCKSGPNLMYEIIVLPTLIKSVNYNNTLDVHQNGTKIFFNNPQNLLAKITIYTLDGKRIFESETNGSIIEIGNTLFQNGIYIYNLKVQNEFVSGKYMNYKIMQK